MASSKYVGMGSSAASIDWSRRSSPLRGSSFRGPLFPSAGVLEQGYVLA